MRERTLIGIGFSSLAMSICVANVDNEEFRVLEFWQKATNLTGLLNALRPYRGQSETAIVTPDVHLKNLLNLSESIHLPCIRLEDITLNFAIAGGLIASVINERKFSFIDEESETLITNTLKNDFLDKETPNSPAAEALKYGLGQLIYMSQTKTSGITQQVGAPVLRPLSNLSDSKFLKQNWGNSHHTTAFDAANHSNNAYAGQDWGRRW